MAGPTDLYDVAYDLLTVCAEALETVPVADASLKGAPARMFVSPGAPVADCCEQLAVYCQQITDRQVGAIGGIATVPKASNIKLNLPLLLVIVTRCIPEGQQPASGKYKPPSAVALGNSAKQIHADGWALWNHIFNAIRAETFLDRCASATFQSMISLSPSGGCAGWQLNFQVQVNGYEEVFGT